MATKQEKEWLLALYSEAAHTHARLRAAGIPPSGELFYSGFAHGLSRAIDIIGIDSQERYDIWNEAQAAAETWWADYQGTTDLG